MTLKDHNLSAGKPAPKAKLGDIIADMTDEQLLSLRQKIDMKLKVDLSRLDLAEELGLQYRGAMVLLDSVQDDADIPANQRAQVLNSVRTTLGEIIKQQKIVYNAERMKRLEAAILKVLQQMPPESTRIFFDLYAEFLAQVPEPAGASDEA